MVGSSMPQLSPHCVMIPPRPINIIHAYAPMKGGDIMESKTRIFRNGFPGNSNRENIYASGIPIKRVMAVVPEAIHKLLYAARMK